MLLCWGRIVSSSCPQVRAPTAQATDLQLLLQALGQAFLFPCAFVLLEFCGRRISGVLLHWGILSEGIEFLPSLIIHTVTLPYPTGVTLWQALVEIYCFQKCCEMRNKKQVSIPFLLISDICCVLSHPHRRWEKLVLPITSLCLCRGHYRYFSTEVTDHRSGSEAEDFRCKFQQLY